MDFSLTPDQEAVRDAVQKICSEFDDDYWLERDQSGDFPEEFYRSIADGGWLGIAMPEEHGGAGLGVTEAALMMHAVAGSSGAMSRLWHGQAKKALALRPDTGQKEILLRCHRA
jgi:acyl-CoA dehydrogenase